MPSWSPCACRPDVNRRRRTQTTWPCRLAREGPQGALENPKIACPRCREGDRRMLASEPCRSYSPLARGRDIATCDASENAARARQSRHQTAPVSTPSNTQRCTAHRAADHIPGTASIHQTHAHLYFHRSITSATLTNPLCLATPAGVPCLYPPPSPRSSKLS